MKLLKSFLFLIFSLFMASAQAQNPDSLFKVWENKRLPDTTRLNAMQQFIFEKHMLTQPDSAFYFAQLQYDFAKKKGHKKQMGEALSTQARVYFMRGEVDRSIDALKTALNTFKEIKDKKNVARALNNIGLIYKVQGEYKQALDYYHRSLKIEREIKNSEGIARMLLNIGAIYQEQGDYSRAIDYYIKNLKISEEIGYKDGMASSLSNLGTIYDNQGDDVPALDYYKRSLKIYEELGDQESIAFMLANIGLLYQDKGKWAKSLDYFSRSLKIYEENAHLPGIGQATHYMGITYQKQGQNVRAMDHYVRSRKIYEEVGDGLQLVTLLCNMSSIYRHEGNYAKAISLSTEAMQLARQTGAVTSLFLAAEELYKAYKQSGNPQKALEMYELYNTISDSIDSDKNQKEIIRQDYKYQYEKEAVADSLKAQAKIHTQQLQIEKEETQRYALYGGVGLLLVFGGFMYNRFRITHRQKGVIEKQKTEVEHQKHLVEEKNQEITDSITYAKRLQDAILPPQKLVKEYLTNSFILYKPKDIVAGDFYWMENSSEHFLFAVADCTGHGVPGAMVSVVCAGAMNRTVKEFGITEPGKVLDKVRELVIETFEKSESDVKDGMDISLCALNLSSGQLLWSGANNPLWIVRHNATELEETKANKQPIAKYADLEPFTTHSLQLYPGDCLYLFSDGFSDQFGGEKNKKFMSANFKKLLVSIHSEDMDKQKELVNEAFETWKGDFEQVDDVCVIGVRI